MRATIALCDWAEVIQGKLYLQGGGWNKILANAQQQVAVAVLFRIEYLETNSPVHAVLALDDEDGGAVAPPGTTGPIKFDFNFEVGRPPGMRPGETQTIPFAGKVGGLILPPGGFRWELDVNDHRQDAIEFRAVTSLT
jgi:hypothetical protein